MAYKLKGLVEFHFSDLVMEGNDEEAALRYVESMHPSELLDYATGAYLVQIEQQELVD